MDKDEAIKIIVKCALEYSNNLANRNLLFLCGNPKTIRHYETIFLPRHFMHLTGTTYEGMNSTAFYKIALNNRISPDKLIFVDKKTTEIKLNVLLRLMSIHKEANMIGTYNQSKPLLNTDKLVGDVYACMGFVSQDSRYFVPNTALGENIKNITTRHQERVLAVFRKNVDEKCYQEVCKIANGIVLENINIPDELKSKIALNPSIMFGKVVNSDSENKELNILPSEKIVNDNLPEKEENQSSNKAPASFERRHIADIMKDAKEKADRINSEIAKNSQKNKGFDR